MTNSLDIKLKQPSNQIKNSKKNESINTFSNEAKSEKKFNLMNSSTFSKIQGKQTTQKNKEQQLNFGKSLISKRKNISKPK